MLEASSAALGGCATGCLKPWNWVGSKGATLGKKVKQKTEVKNVHKPYSNPKQRPKYGKNQVEEAWDSAKQKDGNVYDPNTGELLTWDSSKSRAGQWDIGHRSGKEYRKLHKDYMDDKISKEQFLKEYRAPKNYQPEAVGANRNRRFEDKG